MTGSRGRLADVLCPRLRDAGWDVVSLSRKPGDGHRSIDDLFTTPLIDEADAILHLAWSTVPLLSEANPRVEWDTDLPLLEKILARLEKIETPPRAHLVFFSSGGTVYGNTGLARVTESTPVNPQGWHGRAKLEAENMIHRAAADRGLDTTILRVSNPYGFPHRADRPQGMIAFLLEAVRTARPFQVWGDGLARKDYLHVDDLAAAVLAVLNQRATGVFNVSSGAAHTTLEVIALVERILGHPVPVEFGQAYPWDVSVAGLDNAALRTRTGWKPEISLEDGIARAVRHT